MDRAAAIVHGRRSHEGGPRAAKRKRVVVTRQVPAIAADPSQPNALLWNPAGASLEQAMDALGVGTGSIAVIGGTDVFSLFLPLYDVYDARENSGWPAVIFGGERDRNGRRRADASPPV